MAEWHHYVYRWLFPDLVPNDCLRADELSISHPSYGPHPNHNLIPNTHSPTYPQKLQLDHIQQRVRYDCNHGKWTQEPFPEYEHILTYLLKVIVMFKHGVFYDYIEFQRCTVWHFFSSIISVHPVLCNSHAYGSLLHCARRLQQRQCGRVIYAFNFLLNPHHRYIINCPCG